ncbi:hypothetical protein [Bradyrhizobium sp. SZCCHNR3118]|uniref:hypothetical protein n=1 Tax=Bradyrhizobium sp. SZCCHNR3118 TaxID=3057468 RepID=UPI002916B048|nr:hypothetical protein [Bradyrhizobium sp. SZCCHNR3118]
MNPKLLPAANDLSGQIGRITEECGEVLQEIGKIDRFGLDSVHPNGGLNNAGRLLNEIADLRHALNAAEDNLSQHARARVGNAELVWTDTLIPASELRELIGDEDHKTDDDFNAENMMIAVCAGQWHREGLEWRFYVDPELD